MIRRIVMFKKKPDAGLTDFVGALTDLKTLDSRMSGMSSWWVDIAPGRDDLWDAVLVAEFPTAEIVEAYNSHPEHHAVASRIGSLADVAIFDSTID
jgi:hypothetical protein